jgi:hypothetical protein
VRIVASVRRIAARWGLGRGVMGGVMVTHE